MDLVAPSVKTWAEPPFKKKQFTWAEIMAALMHSLCHRKCQQAKKPNSSCSSQSTSELMKWKTRKKLGLVESAACLSEEGGHIDGLHWKAAKVLMSTEMSSVKSAPSSSAPCCFDREISSCPTLIGRKDWWGFLHEHACTGSTSIPLQQFAMNRQAKMTCCLIVLSPDIPLCLEQAKGQSV